MKVKKEKVKGKDHVTYTHEEERPGIWYVWGYNHTRMIKTLMYIFPDEQKAIQARERLQKEHKENEQESTHYLQFNGNPTRHQ